MLDTELILIISVIYTTPRHRFNIYYYIWIKLVLQATIHFFTLLLTLGLYQVVDVHAEPLPPPPPQNHYHYVQ